ncbi:MAG: putative sulfate/molybdate transporter, partial [Phycisphaerae bacterium]|nr:putative sulfate/molybdate transporter [Phycisphaerae bacterium]
MRHPIRFDRNEFAGAFGDIGTDLPLIVGMVVAAGLDTASAFIMFGVLQVVTGLLYRLPMPVQPLKAMAVLVITQKMSPEVLYGGGLAIGAVMLVLTLTGALSALARLVPLCAVRGVQAGLGLTLASLALKDYVSAGGTEGYVIAGVAFAVMVALLGNRRIPGGLIVIALGAVFALAFRVDVGRLAQGAGFALPKPHVPALDHIWTGFLVLALPQLPLSLSNSVIATRQTVADLFPERGVTIRKIGLTYAGMNLALPWLSGIPVCHGCGGLAGHYAFGARTGGSVIIYGSLYLVIGLFLSGSMGQVIAVFPKPILGVVLLFEAVTLLLFMRDQAGDRRGMMIALFTALIACTLPQGYVVGL